MSTQGHNLNTFKILFLIKGILAYLLIFVGLIYIAMGNFMAEQIQRDLARTGQEMVIDPTAFFTMIGVIMIIFGAVLGTLAIIASRKIAQQKSRTFIIVAAAVNCLSGILGILLCIFAVIELQKPAVKELFTE